MWLVCRVYRRFWGAFHFMSTRWGSAVRSGLCGGAWAVLSLLLLPGPVPGAVLVDLGTSGGVGDPNFTTSPDSNGNHWNNWSTTAPMNNLVDTAGQQTGIGLSIVTAFSGINDPGGLTAPDPLLLGDFAISTATRDYFFTTGSSSFLITGLDSTYLYYLNLFGTRATTIDRVTRYTALGGNGTFEGLLQTSGTNIGSDGAYDGNDDTIIRLSGIRPNASGQILVGVQAYSGGFGYLGALEIGVLPEPSTMGLLGLGGLAFAGALRRRRSALASAMDGARRSR